MVMNNKSQAIGAILFASLALVSCREVRTIPSVSDATTDSGNNCGNLQFTFGYRNEYPIAPLGGGYTQVRKFYDTMSSYGGNGPFRRVMMSTTPDPTGNNTVLLALSSDAQTLGIPWVSQTQPTSNRKFAVNGLRVGTGGGWGSGYGSTDIGTLIFDTARGSGPPNVTPETLNLKYYGSTPKELVGCGITSVVLDNPDDSVAYYIPTFRLEPKQSTDPERPGWTFDAKTSDPFVFDDIRRIPDNAALSSEKDVFFDPSSMTYRRVIKFIDQNLVNSNNEYTGDIQADILSFATSPGYISDPNQWLANGVLYSSRGFRIDFSNATPANYLPGHKVAVFDYVVAPGSGQQRYSEVLIFAP